MTLPEDRRRAPPKLEEIIAKIESDPAWKRARDPATTLTFTEREQIQSEFAEAVSVITAMAAPRSNPGPAASREAAAQFGARIVNEISGSRRLVVMLNERAPGIMEKPRSLDRLTRITLRAGKRMKKGPTEAASEADEQAVGGGDDSAAADRELDRLKKSTSLFRLYLLSPLLTVIADAYHFLARLLVSNGWYLYSKIINFYWRFPVTKEQQAELRSHLQPGDLLVRRREVITTLFIPGYWTHMILYLGSYEDAVAFFDTGEVNDLFRSMGYAGFADCLAKRHPHALAAWTEPNFIDGSENIVLEATANGVVLNSERQALTANSIGALRMKISGPALALGVIDALGTVGKDFNYSFSFERYENLICTQVVATSFAEGPSLAGEKQGVYFEQETIKSFGLRKHGVSPNEFARQYVKEKESGSPQFEFVYFLEGVKKKHETITGTEESFCTTPDW